MTRRHRLAAGVIVVLVLVAVGAFLAARGSDPPERLGEIERVAERVHRCGSGVHSRPSPNQSIQAWTGVHERTIVSCGPPDYLDPMLTWVSFASRDDLLQATRAEDRPDGPICVSRTEAFFVYFDHESEVRGFCRQIGASAPVGKPIT